MCLVGEPVEPGRHASEKLRAIDIGLVATGDGPSAWPGRCRRHAAELAPLLSSSARHDRRAELAATLAARIASPVDASRVDPALVDALSDAMATLRLPPAAATVSDDPPPPPAVVPDMARSALAFLGTAGSLVPAAPDPLPGASLRLAWGGHAPAVCRFEPGLARAHCLEARGIPDDAQIVPVAEDDAAPSTLVRVLFTHDAPAGIVRAEDGKRIADDWKLPAFVRADGAILVVEPVHGASILLRSEDEIGLAIPGNASTSAIAGDAIVWVDADRLRAREVDRDGSMGPITDVAPLPPGEHAFAMCRTRRALVVRVTTGERASTVFRVDRAWSAAVDSPRADRPASFACDGDRMALTWFERDVVHENRMQSRGVLSRRGGPRPLLGRR